MNKSTLLCLMLAGVANANIASAADFDVSIQNISRGLYFTPQLVVAHPDSMQVFTVNTAASPELQSMAEGGSLAGLEMAMTSAGATQGSTEGLLAAGMSSTVSLNTDNATANTELSVVGMILPSNDGFIGLNSITIPTEAGTYTYNVNAYDAGTEANDELRGSGAPGMAGMPVPPPLEPLLGSNGTGVTASTEGFVHIHRGSLGDSDEMGGFSDIDNTVHRWLNPVARITITVR